MGGPTSYSNVVLHETHRHLDIDDQAFEEMISLFRATLEGTNIAHADVETIIADLNARRIYIVAGAERG
jgi:sugar (pentulose or hexulose) kinase